MFAFEKVGQSNYFQLRLAFRGKNIWIPRIFAFDPVKIMHTISHIDKHKVAYPREIKISLYIILLLHQGNSQGEGISASVCALTRPGVAPPLLLAPYS